METAGYHQSSKLNHALVSMEDDLVISTSEDDKKKRSNNNNNNNNKKGSSSNNGGSSNSQRCCQAEKCSADLSDAKQYHKRHKVCEYHAKAQVVAVAGLRQRFCQQCSRFHEVTEFDESKRSCRRRLAGHNERRRKSSSSSSADSTAEASSRSKGTSTVDERARIQLTTIQQNSPFKNFHLR